MEGLKLMQPTFEPKTVVFGRKPQFLVENHDYWSKNMVCDKNHGFWLKTAVLT